MVNVFDTQSPLCSSVLHLHSIHHVRSSSPRPTTSLGDPLVLGLHPALPVIQTQTSILWPLPPSILSGPCHLPNLISFPLTLEQMAGALLSLCERDWQEPVINLHRQPVACRSAPLGSARVFSARVTYPCPLTPLRSPPNLLCFTPFISTVASAAASVPLTFFTLNFK